ncbi:MAG: peptidase [Gammaproteobacteria bacterium HGW-Gammaproteobacteria-6]|nr:MAG: peptidase [Gammaproteobacteria bacterium HGW-Gammaproteobacteria-6]
MKKYLVASVTAVLALGSVAVLADDVRVDQAQALVNDGSIQSFDVLNEKALAARAGNITDTELENEYGRYIYKLDIRDAQGQEWDLELDAATGEVVKNERDD